MGIFIPLRGGAPRPSEPRKTAPTDAEYEGHVRQLMLEHSLGRLGTSRRAPTRQGEGGEDAGDVPEDQ